MIRVRQRIKDPEFLKKIRTLKCVACRHYRSEAHHIKTKGSGGDDSPFNVIPLCSNCHTQSEYAWHRNRARFFKKFPHVLVHLKSMGWELWGEKLFHQHYRLNEKNSCSV